MATGSLSEGSRGGGALPGILAAVAIVILMCIVGFQTKAQAYYDVTVGTASTNGSWSGGNPDFWTPSASGSTVSATEIETRLNSGTLVVIMTGGGGAEAGDILVTTPVSWSANTLMLNAQNNINIYSPMDATGTAGLVLAYGQSSAGGGSTYNLHAPVNLASTATFATELGIGGLAINWTIITTLGSPGSTTGADLQGIGGFMGRNYVLGANIDASQTSNWNAGAGFTPIGTTVTLFSGRFDGLGHTISNLTVKPGTTGVGLFGGNSGTIRNVGLVNASVEGGNDTGALVGFSTGTISNSYATGSVDGAAGWFVGGLVGNNTGTITAGYSGASVQGGRYVGGLAGLSTGTVSNSYATGSVSGSQYVGGLAGQDSGTATQSYATGSVTGSIYVGGLVGIITDRGATISNSYATGNVLATGPGAGVAGGLVAYSRYAVLISDSYATGNVSGPDVIGGLVGRIDAASSVFNSYDSGSVTATSASATYVGTIFGADGGATTGGLAHLTTTQMQTQSSFNTWDFNNTWVIYEGHTDPLLRTFMTPLTVTAGGMTTYSGTAVSGLSGLSYSPPNVDTAHLYGTTVYSNTGMVNAGSYSGVTVSGLYSDQQGYVISYGGAATVAITQAPLTVTANDAGKTYDGSGYSGGNGVSYSGFVNSETSAVLGGTLAYGGASQGAVDVGSYSIIPSGLTSANYDISYVNGTLTITALPTAYSGATATGSGTARVTMTGDGIDCGFASAEFVHLSSVGDPPPPGVSFPHGLFEFTTAGCTAGSPLTVTVTYPSTLPAGTQYWKYGPTPDKTTPHWYVLPARILGDTATFTITDGGKGDDDLSANGSIADQGGPGVPPATPVPAMNGLGMDLFMLFAGLLALYRLGGE